MGRKKRHDAAAAAAAARADDSVPFGFLLGEQYSGYYQALNSSKDLKVRTRETLLCEKTCPSTTQYVLLWTTYIPSDYYNVREYLIEYLQQ